MAVTDVDPAPAGDAAATDPESLAPAVTRAAGILHLLAENGGMPAGPSELARRLGLPKSSIANISSALADTGLLRRVGTGFALGRGLAELGGAYLATVDEVQEFYETCHELRSEETVQLAILDGAEMTYLARHDGQQPVRLTSQIGRRLAASHTATGKAALATLDDEEVRQRFEGRHLPVMTSRSHPTVEALLEDLAVVRQRGYAIDDEETVEGVICYGISVRGRRQGEGPYAASITLLKVRATDERELLLRADLRLLQARLSDPLRADLRPRGDAQSP